MWFRSNAGIEVSVAATKCIYGSVAALYWLGLYLAEQKSSLDGRVLLEMKRDLLLLPAQTEEILSHSADIQKQARKLCKFRSFLYMARGINLTCALEGALKLKEISYINANAYAAGGTQTRSDCPAGRNMPVMAVLGPGATQPKMISNCMEAKARNAPLAAVISEKEAAAPELF